MIVGGSGLYAKALLYHSDALPQADPELRTILEARWEDDPDGLIKQFYIQGDDDSASGGFLLFEVERKNGTPTAAFKFYDEKANLLYQENKEASL